MKRLASYSQHFIRNPRLIKELVGHSNLKKTDLVYDLGAGSGVITSILASRCKQVVAIESEPKTAQKLRENMTRYTNVTVHRADIMDTSFPRTPYKIFANIPFHLSSPIIHKITESPHSPLAAYLIVQKQFAYKLLPNSDRFTGQLGMMIGPEFAVRIRKRLQKTDYWPHPNVDTVFIEIIKREKPLVDPALLRQYKKFVVDCFSTPKIFQKTPYIHIGLPADIKPSQMKLDDWVHLFEAYIGRDERTARKKLTHMK